MPRTSFCLLAPPGSPDTVSSASTAFLPTSNRNRSLARADSSSAPGCFDTNYMKSDTGGWLRGKQNLSSPFPGGFTTQERQERLMLSSAVADPFFLHRNANPSRFVSFPFALLFALVCDADHLRYRGKKRAMNSDLFLSLSRLDDLLNDLLKYQNEEDVFWHSIYGEEYICVSFWIKLEHRYKFRKDLKH